MSSKKVLLWLDDCRNPLIDDWLIFSPIGRDISVVWVKSYKEFVEYILNNELPHGICFDHDLGDIVVDEEERTGYDCAKFLVEHCIDKDLDLPPFNSQSANPSGRENIMKLLNNYKNFRNDN